MMKEEAFAVFDCLLLRFVSCNHLPKPTATENLHSLMFAFMLPVLLLHELFTLFFTQFMLPQTYTEEINATVFAALLSKQQ